MVIISNILNLYWRNVARFFLFFCVVFSENGSTSANDEIDMPSIIWWTPRLFPHTHTDDRVEGSVSPDNEEHFVTVPNSHGGGDKCYTTTKKDRIHQMTRQIAFIFYGTDMEIEDLPLPRLANHQWALLHEESPMNNYMLSHSDMIELFNYTATFRRQSDYPLTTLFVANLAYLSDRQPVPVATKNKFRAQKESLAPVLYLQSHCDVASDRDRYVSELSKYVRIDSYGQCLNNRTLPPDLVSTETFESEDLLSFIGRYKFHLAFENAICVDYVTEKLFRALHVGSVPVYRGSPTVTDWDPNFKSVIQVEKFASPKDLADFINYLDTNDDAYETYLSFKKPGGITNELLLSNLATRDWSNVDYDKDNFIQGFEHFLCEKLLDYETSVSFNRMKMIPKMANMNHVGCPEPSPSIGVLEDLSSSEKSNLMEWIENYRYGEDLAKAIHKMVQMNFTDSSQVHNIAYLNYRDEL